MSEADSDPASNSVLVQVTDVRSGREIGFSENIAVGLASRAADIQNAVRETTEIMVASAAPEITEANWQVDHLTVKFSLSLTTEGSCIVAKGTASGTLDIAIDLRKRPVSP